MTLLSVHAHAEVPKGELVVYTAAMTSIDIRQSAISTAIMYLVIAVAHAPSRHGHIRSLVGAQVLVVPALIVVPGFSTFWAVLVPGFLQKPNPKKAKTNRNRALVLVHY